MSKPSLPTAQPLRIVRLANFVAPASGGLRTALRELGAGYRAAGHDPVLIVPGARVARHETEQGTVITLPGPTLPGTGGYRVLADRRRLTRLLERLAPDRIEVSDRTTLRWTGEWARRARVPAVMVSHETADGVLRTWGVPQAAARRAADALNARTAWAYTRVVCTTEWAEREFVRIGARNVVRAPLGVDLEGRHPRLADARLREIHAGRDEVLLVLCSRLSVEKRPGTALDTLAVLRGRGVRARLVIAGDGPLKSRLEQRARQRRLPITFLGHVADRDVLGALQATADVCLAPGPAETFGLAALEALACGTPVVVSASSALPQIIGTAGIPAADSGEAFADAVLAMLGRPEHERRQRARARAECFGWKAAVEGFLRAHDAAVRVGAPLLADVAPAHHTPAGLAVTPPRTHERAVPANEERARTHDEAELVSDATVAGGHDGAVPGGHDAVTDGGRGGAVAGDRDAVTDGGRRAVVDGGHGGAVAAPGGVPRTGADAEGAADTAALDGSASVAAVPAADGLTGAGVPVTDDDTLFATGTRDGAG